MEVDIFDESLLRAIGLIMLPLFLEFNGETGLKDVKKPFEKLALF